MCGFYGGDWNGVCDGVVTSKMGKKTKKTPKNDYSNMIKRYKQRLLFAERLDAGFRRLIEWLLITVRTNFFSFPSLVLL